jgi:tryptophan-rich sensory protein
MPSAIAYQGRRSVQHVLTGVAITAGAVALSAVLAKVFAPQEDDGYVPLSDYEDPNPPPKLEKPKRALFAALWPPLYLALTLSGLKIWNAPRSPARTQALTLWGVTQALNAAWMAFGPARLGGQLATAVASLGAAGAYAWRAGKVDPGATAAVVAPYAGWMGVASALKDELLKKSEAKPTVH